MIPFVGRPGEQALLLEHWERALTGSSQQVLLRGEAGIGKTRLVDELAARVRSRGGRVLRGRCWDLGDAPAYWPWSQALGAHLDEVGAATVAPLVADLDPAVVRLMPRLQPVVRVPDPHDDGSAAAQLRLFEAVTVLLRRLGADRPLLVVLDDLESADEPSLLLLRFLARMGRLGSVLLLGAYRTPVPPAAPSAGVLDQLANDPGIQLLQLGGLDTAELGLLMEAMTGKPVQAPVIEAVHARTGGNPLFASEFIRLLAASPTGAAAQLSWSPLPSGVRGVIERRLASLPAGCRLLLQTCAVNGREVDLTVVARAARMSADELLQALAPALAESVLVPVPGRPMHLAFSHPLIRDSLYQGIAPVALAERHREMADTLRALAAPGSDEHLATIASHYVAALAVGSAPLAIEYCQRAARRAIGVAAPDEAVRLLELALEAARTLDADGRRWCTLSLELAEALDRAGRVADARAMLIAVAERAERVGLPQEVALAAVGLGGRFIWTRAGHDPREVPLLERALGGLGEHELALQARVLARLAALQRDRSRIAETVAGCRRAVELARRSGDPTAMIQSLSALVFVLLGSGTTLECRAAIDELDAVARTHGDPDQQMQALLARSILLLDAGDTADADAQLEVCVRLSERLGQPVQRWITSACRAELALLRGDLGQAETLVAEVERVGSSLHRPEAPYMRLVPRYLMRRDQGRLAELEREVADAASALSPFALVRLLPFHLAAEQGRYQEAQLFLDRHARNGFAELQDSVGFRLSLALLIELVHRTAHVASAEILEPVLAAQSRRFLAAPPTASAGSVARYRGLLAATLGRREEAERWLTEGARENRSAGAMLWALRCELDLARLILVDGHGERAQGRLLLEAVTAEAQARGLGGLLAEGERLRAQLSGQPVSSQRLPAIDPVPAFRRDGDQWTVEFAGATFRLRDGKGLRYLGQLLAHGGQELPVLQLLAVSEGATAVTVDPRARADFQRQVAELDDEIEQAQRWNDLERAARARGEREELLEGLASTVGGRERSQGEQAERARQSVTKAIKSAIRRIGEEHRELGLHFGATVHTGLLCRYQPDPLRPTRWRVEL
jgi:hypothetical protein